MSQRPKFLLPLGILLFAVVGAFLLVKFRQTPERARPPLPAPLVRVQTVHAQEVRLDVTSSGQVRPKTATVLVAQVAGRVDSVSDQLASGAFFSKGDVLARIDPRDYRVGVAQAEAGLALAQVTLAREEGEARVARADWEDLGEGDADPLALREPQLAGARAALASARAALDKARLDLERTEIRAPYDGRVRARSVDVGQFVAPGTPLATVFATEAAEIRLGLPADRVGDLDLDFRNGNAPRVTLRAEFAGRWSEWEGRVVRSEGEIDPASRMLHVIAQVEDPFGRAGGAGVPLPSGLFVAADIEGRRLTDVFVLPREALRDGRRVLVLRDDRLYWQDVTVIRTYGDEAVVRGLADGAVVCVSDPQVATDGMRVRVEQTSPESVPAPVETEVAPARPAGAASSEVGP